MGNKQNEENNFYNNKNHNKKNLISLNKKKTFKFEETITKNSFEFLNIIGRGGFGKVWKVYSKKYKTNFAMKVMDKIKIIEKHSENNVKTERDFLSVLNHPFIINMHFSFQDNNYLYIVMDYLSGGDLRFYISRKKINFNEQQTKFLIACIILSLEYIHSNNIIHRDLKPENLVFDKNGYLKLTDFGLAKYYTKNNYKDTSGTVGYMSPEVMCCQNHTIAVDYFALGVITYELMFGIRPYYGKNYNEIKEKILNSQVQIKKNPKKWSFESVDFINKLLQRKPANRLGLRGPKEVKEHFWFKNFDWKNLYKKNLKAKFIPIGTENFNKNYCNEEVKIGINTQERYIEIEANGKTNLSFKDFYYFNRFDEDENGKNKYNKIKNPHLIYLDDNEKSKNNKNKMNKSFNFCNQFGIDDEKYLVLRKISSSQSSSFLIKQYKMKKSYKKLNNSMNNIGTNSNISTKLTSNVINNVNINK